MFDWKNTVVCDSKHVHSFTTSTTTTTATSKTEEVISKITLDAHNERLFESMGYNLDDFENAPLISLELNNVIRNKSINTNDGGEIRHSFNNMDLKHTIHIHPFNLVKWLDIMRSVCAPIFPWKNSSNPKLIENLLNDVEQILDNKFPLTTTTTNTTTTTASSKSGDNGPLNGDEPLNGGETANNGPLNADGSPLNETANNGPLNEGELAGPPLNEGEMKSAAAEVAAASTVETDRKIQEKGGALIARIFKQLRPHYARFFEMLADYNALYIRFLSFRTSEREQKLLAEFRRLDAIKKKSIENFTEMARIMWEFAQYHYPSALVPCLAIAVAQTSLFLFAERIEVTQNVNDHIVWNPLDSIANIVLIRAQIYLLLPHNHTWMRIISTLLFKTANGQHDDEKLCAMVLGKLFKELREDFKKINVFSVRQLLNRDINSVITRKICNVSDPQMDAFHARLLDFLGECQTELTTWHNHEMARAEKILTTLHERINQSTEIGGGGGGSGNGGIPSLQQMTDVQNFGKQRARLLKYIEEYGRKQQQQQQQKQNGTAVDVTKEKELLAELTAIIERKHQFIDILIDMTQEDLLKYFIPAAYTPFVNHFTCLVGMYARFIRNNMTMVKRMRHQMKRKEVAAAAEETADTEENKTADGDGNKKTTTTATTTGGDGNSFDKINYYEFIRGVLTELISKPLPRCEDVEQIAMGGRLLFGLKDIIMEDFLDGAKLPSPENDGITITNGKNKDGGVGDVIINGGVGDVIINGGAAAAAAGGADGSKPSRPGSVKPSYFNLMMLDLIENLDKWVDLDILPPPPPPPKVIRKVIYR